MNQASPQADYEACLASIQAGQLDPARALLRVKGVTGSINSKGPVGVQNQVQHYPTNLASKEVVTHGKALQAQFKREAASFSLDDAEACEQASVSPIEIGGTGCYYTA